ncbi:MAG: hypothetical protein KIS94_15190 [Chitinophagales bacterium]|nr:hypothetical protein [Chitinophagales bacterium]
MKKLLLLTAFFGWLFVAAQPYGNEWIDYANPNYYKIKVVKDGIYRIPYSTLQSVGLGSALGDRFALYHNGQEVPLYVTVNGAFGSGDYIEFYGKKNIGDIDSFLYKTSALQSHPYYSLFTDTSVYFLTVKNTAGNLRYTQLLNSISNPPPKDPYFMCTVRNIYTGRYYEGRYYNASGDEVYKSSFEDAEGYIHNTFFGTVASGNPPQQTALSFTVETPYINTSGGNATLKTVFINNSNESHAARITFNGNILFTQTLQNGFRLNKHDLPIAVNQLATSNTIVFSETATTPVSRRQNAVCLNEITYPRDFNFGGANSFNFSIGGSAAPNRYIEITNFDAQGSQPVLYDLTNRVIIKYTGSTTPGPIKFGLPGSPNPRDLYLISGSTSSYTEITQITPVQFINYKNDVNRQGNYLIISHPKLNDGTSADRVEEYRTYRSGTNYIARTYDINQLYDQFGYGVMKSPLAIRNFIQMAYNTWAISPTHVFLIGKGREYNFMRNGGSAYNQCLVPTFGYPGSDNLFAGTRLSDEPLVAVGRLAAETPQQIKDYLDKVKKYEEWETQYDFDQKIAPKIWQKQALLFSGGTSQWEIGTFKSYCQSYEKIFEDTSWGGNAKLYTRTTTTPIPQSQSDEIRQRINDGISLVTFFGHSATGAFDFSVDEPEDYKNKDKYPVFISNGCFAGLIHDANKGYSERFVFKPEAGTIAFIATTSLSLPEGLHKFTSNFYKRFTGSYYTETLGECMAKALNDVYTSSPSHTDLMVAYEFTLHGDPGIFFNQYPKPDYAIEESSVFFTPSTITPGLDSFEVSLVITNLGKAIKDSIAVTLNRIAKNANNNDVNAFYKKIIKGPYYIDTLTFRLPVLFSSVGYGPNRFEFYVDADFERDEMAEGNNGLQGAKAITITIQGDDIIPIYPYEFAIVPKQGVTLKASTVNPFAKPRNYKFQIDTTELFNSPLLQTQLVYQSGGVVKWTPTITYMDSVVYYWRVAIDSTVPNWHYTSFVYIKDEDPGWNQSHYFQWLKDDFLNVSLANDRIFKFPPSVNEIKVVTGRADAVGGNLNSALLGWDYNNNNMHRYRMGGCPTGGQQFLRGLTFAVIDNVTGVPWISSNKNGDNWGDKYGNWHCSDKAPEQYGFDFTTSGSHPTGVNPAWSGIPWSQAISDFIDDIPCDYYVLVYSSNDIAYTAWDNQLVQALMNLGFGQAQQFQSGQLNGPFVFFTQKCNGSYSNTFSTVSGYTNPLTEYINFNGAWYQGNFTTPLIGPAFGWESMHWRKQAMENPTTDIDTVDIIGVTKAGAETVLLRTTQFDNLALHQQIDASVYPFIRLRLRTFDDSLRTPTQLKYWRVLYKKAPEAAMNPSAHFLLNDSLPLGGNLHLEIGLENVTEIPMDSMLTKYLIRDAANNNYTQYIRYDSLQGLSIMHLVYDTLVNSANYSGTNKIIIEANPNDDQLEQYHFNNFAEIDFTTTGDKINPLLDVTFDGQHIFNGDIVSAKPTILITLKDENKFLALNDTSLITVFLKHPGEATPRRMSYDDVVMKFYPADSTNLAKRNQAQVELTPVLAIDGTYELIVVDRDRSGNNSSTTAKLESSIYYDYKISFEVINKPMVTNVLNYPNPFTTSTRFVFTLTGTEVPDYMKIQIMTIKGTVVREITKDELGPLHIGRNITEYAWDGRDQYGDLLANGIYFYRVVTRLDDKKMDHLSQGYDKYFKKGFGKMAIIR